MQIDISVLVTIGVGVCTILTFIKTNAKSEAKRASEMAVLHNELKHQGEDIKELSDRVNKHNNFAQRMPVIEEKIENLEEENKKTNNRISNLSRRNSI